MKNGFEQAVKNVMKKKGWDEARSRRYLSQGFWINLAEVDQFLSPGAGDVHVNNPTGDDDKKNRDTFSISSIPIFKAGVHKGEGYSIEDLDEIVKNTSMLIKMKAFEPVLSYDPALFPKAKNDPAGKLGHNEGQGLLQQDGWPAAGYISNVYREGNYLFVDMYDIPKVVYELIEKGAYKGRSAEIYKNFQNPETKEDMGKVLRAVAFLGMDIPEVKGLGDILALYHSEKKQKLELAYTSFSEDDFKEAKKMKWTLERVKAVYPCCTDAVKKFMEEKKITEVSFEDVARIVGEVQAKKYDEAADGAGDAKTCPQGYKWDDGAGRCMSANADDAGKPEAQKVCPEGYTFDDVTGKCKPADVQTNSAKKKMDPKALMTALMKAAGITVDDKKPIEDQMPDEDQMSALIEKMKTQVPPPPANTPGKMDDNPENWKPEDVAAAKDAHAKDADPKKDEMADGQPDGQPDDAWMKSCQAKVGGDNAAKVCGHIWKKQKGAKAAPPAADAAKAAETAEIKALKEQVKKHVVEKYKEAVTRVLAESNKVILPKHKPAIDALVSYFTETESAVIKFGEKKEEISIPDLFLKLLRDVSADKIVIFEELSKNQNEKLQEEKKMVDEKRKAAMVKEFSEVAEGKTLDNVDLALLAEDIAKAENLPYKAALKKAAAQIKANGGKN
jgi:hypothetical protein